MGACEAPPFPHPLSHPQTRKLVTKIKNWKSPIISTHCQLPNRRLFLFSLPLSGFLLLPTSSADKFAYGSSYDPVSTAERNASAAISQRVSEAVDLLEKGKELQAQGDFNAALRYFSQVILTLPLPFTPVKLTMVEAKLILCNLVSFECVHVLCEVNTNFCGEMSPRQYNHFFLSE